jgi:hypothetical protein
MKMRRCIYNSALHHSAIHFLFGIALTTRRGIMIEGRTIKEACGYILPQFPGSMLAIAMVAVEFSSKEI